MSRLAPVSRSVFEHAPTPWTVGLLMRSLEGIPPETVLAVHVAASPGREVWEEQVVVGLWNPDMADEPIVAILADMPPGLYLKEVEQ
ncbi:DUF6225 family protein [Streptomyces paradoxus]|uniref:DUF6225 family protein n=1 Tax=Streptomyces paradoxus TaxID=66375 RepID=UPI0037017432